MSCARSGFSFRRARADSLRFTRTAARPTKAAPRKPLESHFKTDSSGRMHINEDSDSDTEAAARDGAISSMGAYLEAMRGEDGHTRDAKGKAKFNKTQGKRARGEGGEEEDVPVTEGLRELDIEKGKRNKKQKRETVQIGGEFKAKVRFRSRSSFLLRRTRLTFLLFFSSHSAPAETSRKRMVWLLTPTFPFPTSPARRAAGVPRLASPA